MEAKDGGRLSGAKADHPASVTYVSFTPTGPMRNGARGSLRPPSAAIDASLLTRTGRTRMLHPYPKLLRALRTGWSGSWTASRLWPGARLLPDDESISPRRPVEQTWTRRRGGPREFSQDVKGVAARRSASGRRSPSTSDPKADLLKFGSGRERTIVAPPIRATPRS